MTTNPSVFNEIRKAVDSIDEQVDESDIDRPDAKELIQVLEQPGGGIEVLGDSFEPVVEPIRDVRNRMRNEYDMTYGIDGSTTKDMRYNNGLILSVSVAGASVTSDDQYGIGEMNTVSITLYFDDKIDIDIDSEKNNVVLYDQYPEPTVSRNLPSWITDIGRMQAEGNHFRRVSSQINAPLFVDGPLIPQELILWSSYDSSDVVDDTPMEAWSNKVYDVLQSYIDGIDNAMIGDYPVFGVQKSTKSTRIIKALPDIDPSLEGDIPWANDSMLFNSALSNSSKGSTISYTPWYTENTIYADRGIGETEPFSGVNEVDFDMSYKDYKGAFFFVKPQDQTTVYRVGVPRMLLEMNDRDYIRDIALNEMITKGREPHPVVLADQKIRIPRNARGKIRKLINEGKHIDANEQRNYK